MENIKEKAARRFSEFVLYFIYFVFRISISLIFLALWILFSVGIFKLVLKIPIEFHFDFETVLYLVILAYLFAGNLKISSQIKRLEEKVLRRQ